MGSEVNEVPLKATSGEESKAAKIAALQNVDVRVVNRQRAVCLDLERVRAVVRAAVPHCAAVSGRYFPAVLAEVGEVDVSLIGDKRMAREHARFLNDPSVTDVITFPYGDILVCPAVAAGRAPEFGHSVEDEVALYIIHGLLHLQGFDDLSHDAAREMHLQQAKILKEAQKSA